jgi:Mg2+ and Co2+ transporter CorA
MGSNTVRKKTGAELPRTRRCDKSYGESSVVACPVAEKMQLDPTAPPDRRTITPVQATERGVVAFGVYQEGKRIADIPINEAGKWSTEPGHVVWIGLYEPDLDLLHRLQKQFGLHPLAIEDAGRAHQRPKVEQYGESLFIVARTAQIVDQQIAYGETHLFVGHGFVISVRHGASTSYSAVRERSESCPKMLSHGEDYILYAILDFIVDNYVPVIETVHAEVDQILPRPRSFRHARAPNKPIKLPRQQRRHRFDIAT